MDEKEHAWYEWPVLSSVMEHIPKQFQDGTHIGDVILTCLSSFVDHLIIGTNLGIVYVVHLPSLNIVKLICEKRNAVCTVSSVQATSDMVAAGSINGTINIFKLPHFSGVTSGKTIKRFTVAGLHECQTTCMTWSRNGMKLFTGDKLGIISVIEVDYDYWSCTGKCLHSESCEIIQMSYECQYLAVSTYDRCVILSLSDSSVIQVGQKPRKNAGRFGAAWNPATQHLSQQTLFTTRPGSHLWLASARGEVIHTVVLKELPRQANVSLLASQKLDPGMPYDSVVSLGLLLPVNECLLLSYTETQLIIFNPTTVHVAAYAQCSDKLRDVTVSCGVVFFLEGSRTIKCVSPKKPKVGTLTKESDDNIGKLFSTLKDPSMNSLVEIGTKIISQGSTLLDGLSKIKDILEPTVVDGVQMCEDAQEIHIVDCCPHQQDRVDVFCEMNVTERKSFEFSQNLHKPHAVQDVFNSDHADSSPGDPVVIRKKRKRVKKDGNEVLSSPDESSCRSTDVSDTDNSSPVSDETGRPDLVTDNRTFEDFKSGIQEKENILAGLLNLETLKIDHEKSGSFEFSASLESHMSKGTRDSVDISIDTLVYEKSNQETSDASLNSELDYLYSGASLGYGPPSGSSALLSMNNMKNADFISPLNLESVFVECQSEFVPCLMGQWQKFEFPCSLKCMTASYNSVFMLCDNNLLYYLNNTSPSGKWMKLSIAIKDKLRTLAVSPNNRMLCFLKHESPVLFCINTEALQDPCVDDIVGICDVLDFSLDRDTLWYIKENGQVYVRLISDGMLGDELMVKCESCFQQIIACSGVVWALTNNGHIAYRIGVPSNYPVGHDWGMINFPSSVKRIFFTPSGIAWIIDYRHRLYFCPGVSEEFPRGAEDIFWEVLLSENMFNSDHDVDILIASSALQFFIAEMNQKFIYQHSAEFLGYNWSPVMEEKWSTIAAEGVYNIYGSLYCLSPEGSFFSVSPKTFAHVPLDLPPGENLLIASQRPENLWILTSSSRIFARHGLSPNTCFGTEWVELDLDQIGDIHLCHISLGSDLVWAVDTRGGVYMREGSLLVSASTHSLSPAWIEVSHVELEGKAKFTQVYVGTKFHMVWAIDSNRCVYVRQAVYRDLPIGVSWVCVEGIKALHLSISENYVYALSPNEEIFKRVGISKENFIGDSWEKIPGSMARISVSIDDELYGLNSSGQICHLRRCTTGDSSQIKPTPPEELINHEDHEWEII